MFLASRTLAASSWCHFTKTSFTTILYVTPLSSLLHHAASLSGIRQNCATPVVTLGYRRQYDESLVTSIGHEAIRQLRLLRRRRSDNAEIHITNSCRPPLPRHAGALWSHAGIAGGIGRLPANTEVCASRHATSHCTPQHCHAPLRVVAHTAVIAVISRAARCRATQYHVVTTPLNLRAEIGHTHGEADRTWHSRIRPPLH